MAGLLNGKVAVVTGGGAGLGAAMARRFAGEGAKVAIAEMNREAGERVAKETGGTAIACDVSKEADVKALFAAVERAYGRLDVLVNNAGATGPTAASEEFDLAAWNALFAVNVAGIMLCIKYAAPLLKRQGGSIVNMSSLSGYKPLAFRTAYGASKFAVRGITESVAQELGPHKIRVNSLCPGGTNTELFKRNNTQRAEREGITFEQLVKRDYLAGTALGILMEPDDIANAALFLASDLSKTITGTHLRIDAGVK